MVLSVKLVILTGHWLCELVILLRLHELLLLHPPDLVFHLLDLLGQLLPGDGVQLPFLRLQVLEVIILFVFLLVIVPLGPEGGDGGGGVVIGENLNLFEGLEVVNV